MRTLLLTAVFAALAGPALAYCPSIPDDAATHYVENQTDRTLCLQSQLSDSTAERSRELQFQAELDARIKTLELNLKAQQNMLALQPPMPIVPMPKF